MLRMSYRSWLRLRLVPNKDDGAWRGRAAVRVLCGAAALLASTGTAASHGGRLPPSPWKAGQRAEVHIVSTGEEQQGPRRWTWRMESSYELSVAAGPDGLVVTRGARNPWTGKLATPGAAAVYLAEAPSSFVLAADGISILRIDDLDAARQAIWATLKHFARPGPEAAANFTATATEGIMHGALERQWDALSLGRMVNEIAVGGEQTGERTAPHPELGRTVTYVARTRNLGPTPCSTGGLCVRIARDVSLDGTPTATYDEDEQTIAMVDAKSHLPRWVEQSLSHSFIPVDDTASGAASHSVTIDVTIELTWK